MILGIDPGQTGGVALINSNGLFVKGMRMPMMAYKKRKMVATNKLTTFCGGVRSIARYIDDIVIEVPNSMPRQGLQSTYNFGRHCGAVEGWAHSVSADVNYATPSQWKTKMGLTSNKRDSMAMAKSCFGEELLWDVLANDGIAESGLLALWFQRYIQRDLSAG